MGESRIAKTLARGAVVSWREQPTQYDIEALRANVARVRLVIQLRWGVVVALAIFSAIAASVYASSTDVAAFLADMKVPVAALVFVVAYNSFYQLTYRKVANIAFLNQAQLLFDVLVTTVLVYYSGGVYSWFGAMYLLFVLEAAFILPRRSDVWMVAGAAAVLYVAVLSAEFTGILPHVDLPFVRNELHAEVTYVLLRSLWMLTLLGGSATVGLRMMKSIRERETELQESSFMDDLTGLFNRQYFHRVLSTEVERSNRNDRGLALVLADIDRFGEINQTFGVDVGDGLLAAVADRLREISGAKAGESGFPVTVACRVGGEELALIVPEVALPDSERLDLGARVLATAEELREAIASVRVSGVGVTASLGVALGPADGDSPDALLDAADRMLSRAARAGGNRVCATWTCERGDDG
ncbi:MAG: GGDEF domain-containing protein [Coriobacteriia bacterium]|nr:GGDEF domain-containing protein [Coriobacteriia bacterium]